MRTPCSFVRCFGLAFRFSQPHVGRRCVDSVCSRHDARELGHAGGRNGVGNGAAGLVNVAEPAVAVHFWHPFIWHLLTLPCSQHSPLLTAHLLQPSWVHFKPPRPRRLPCLLQKPRPRSILVQLGTLQASRRRVRCTRADVADLLHPSAEPCSRRADAEPRSLTGVHPSGAPLAAAVGPAGPGVPPCSREPGTAPPPCAAQRPLK